MEIWVIHTINGVSFGMVLFLFSTGLTLTFGLMNIVNLSHGAFYLAGAFVGLVVMRETGNFLIAILVGSATTALIGLVLERFFLRRIMGQDLAQVLLTIGFALIFADLYLWLGKGLSTMIPKPKLLSKAVELWGILIPSYRLFLIVLGAVVAVCLWYLYERTRLGAMIRAAVDDEEMARGVGLNVPLMFTGVFAFGAFLTAFGGVIGGAILGLYPGVDWDVLLMSMAIIIIGGLGSLKGALIGGLMVGLIDNFGKVFFPEVAYFTIFAPIALILVFRPQGLFGGR